MTDIQLQSEAINELAAALSAAQGEIKNAVKDADNPYFKSKYADLSAIREACREPLAKHGLAVVHQPNGNGSGLVLITTLMHASGQWMRSVLPVRPVKDDPQGLGSALTYMRRYALSAMVGVAAEDEDDDGNAASGKAAPLPKRGALPPMAEEDVTLIVADIFALGAMT